MPINEDYQPEADTESSANPLFAIGVVVLVAIIMIIITTVSFLRSGAYTTVKQIQIGTQAVHLMDRNDLDTTSPINASDIDNIASNIKQQVQTLNDKNDFGPDDVSDSALGL